MKYLLRIDTSLNPYKSRDFMKIVIYCNNLNQLNFFLRFNHVSKSHEIQLVMWSNRLSVVLKARSKGFKAELLAGYDYGNDDCISFDSNDWYVSKRGLLLPHQAHRRVKRLVAIAKRLFEKYEPETLWIWNGSNQLSQALVDVGKGFNVKTLFFDIGNFPGKLFVDPWGINCRSWYVSNRESLRDSDIDFPSFYKWKYSYLSTKQNAHVVPQAKSIGVFNYHYLIDLVGFWFCGAITVEKLSPVWKTVDFVKRQFFQLPFDDFDPVENSSFLFYPLQVSTDSQVLWNCDLSQAEVLRSAAATAKYEGKELVVKPHPAEPHCKALQEIVDLKKELGFKLVNGNTFTFLQCCSRVITLNSTVGLEAMLLGKPVEIVGRALYAGFDELDIANYLQNWLLDIDFFSDTPITERQLEKIIERGVIQG